jgi:hypothetical protein
MNLKNIIIFGCYGIPREKRRKIGRPRLPDMKELQGSGKNDGKDARQRTFCSEFERHHSEIPGSFLNG